LPPANADAAEAAGAVAVAVDAVVDVDVDVDAATSFAAAFPKAVLEASVPEAALPEAPELSHTKPLHAGAFEHCHMNLPQNGPGLLLTLRTMSAGHLGQYRALAGAGVGTVAGAGMG
jgi:hypothetical protein